MPATFSSHSIKPPIHDQITELQRKIQLLEGDKNALYESSQASIQKNRDTILQLRETNKVLHRKLAHTLRGDEQVIKEAFQARGSEKAAYRNMSGKGALQVLDQKVCDKVKKLNAMKHNTNTYRHRLEQLHAQYDNERAQRRSMPSEDDTTNEGDLADLHPQKNLRALENRLEKAQLKCQEAEHIMKSYLKLKEHLQEESLTFQSQLDGLESEILHQKQELQQLLLMNTEAHLAKDATKAELQREEELVYGERRERELILNSYKKQAEERKAQTERGERRAQRGALQQDELSSEAQRSVTAAGEEGRTISSFEEAFQRIKEATGVTHIQEVVDRFISQRQTHTHLEQMKEENERVLQRLKQERESLYNQLQDIKYTGETRLISRRMVMDECESQLHKLQQRRDGAKETQERITHTLNTVSTAMQHLRDKLQHITLRESSVQQRCVSPVDLLYQVEQKLQQLQDELQGQDLHSLTKEMEEQEFHVRIEGKLPQYNTRILLPETQISDLYEDDACSDDDGDVITRSSLKRQSQLIIDSKNKRKTRLRKRKNKL